MSSACNGEAEFKVNHTVLPRCLVETMIIQLTHFLTCEVSLLPTFIQLISPAQGLHVKNVKLEAVEATQVTRLEAEPQLVDVIAQWVWRLRNSLCRRTFETHNGSMMPLSRI